MADRYSSCVERYGNEKYKRVEAQLKESVEMIRVDSWCDESGSERKCFMCNLQGTCGSFGDCRWCMTRVRVMARAARFHPQRNAKDFLLSRHRTKEGLALVLQMMCII